MCCMITAVITLYGNYLFVVIRVFSYPDIFTENSCPMCLDKWITAVLIIMFDNDIVIQDSSI